LKKFFLQNFLKDGIVKFKKNRSYEKGKFNYFKYIYKIKSRFNKEPVIFYLKMEVLQK